MSHQILVVLTSHDKLGDTGKETGFYLPEVSHPVNVFDRAGFTVDYVSPKGGKAPMIGVDLSDPLNVAFVENPTKMAQVSSTKTPTEINPADYVAIFYAGGHGTMWDFANNPDLDRIAAAIYEQGGVVSAVCHGPAGLINIKLSSGNYLVARKRVTGFTNEEEEAMGLTEVVPFSLESTLIERGAIIDKAPNFAAQVIVSDRLVTGQNPASSSGVGEQIVRLLGVMPS
jgi:putative intracellular protease/amidase